MKLPPNPKAFVKNVQQRLVIKLSKKDTAYLIANNQCYYLHNLVGNYESLVIEVKHENP